MHMILKSDLKMAQTSARCIQYLLFEDDWAHNHASYNCKLSNFLSNSNGVRRWARPIAGKGLFRRHDFVSLTKSYMILSCMIFLFRRHYNVMCDFFQQ